MISRKFTTFLAVTGFAFAFPAVGCGGDGGTSRDSKDDNGGSGGSSKSGGSSGSSRSGGSGGSSKSGGSGGSSASGGSGGSSASGGSGGSSASGGSGGSSASGGSGGTQSGGSGATASKTDCSNAKPDLAAGLIGYWQFEDGSGITVKDSSGKGNTGKVVAGGTSASGDHPGPTWATQGKKGKALQFDGVDDWMRVEDSESLDSTGINNGVSMTAWVKIDKLNTVKDHNFIIQRHESGTRLEHFALGTYQGLPQSRVHFFAAVGAQNVPIGEWVHVAGTYDGITIRTYINGAEVSFRDVGWPVAADESPLTIGAAINEEDVIEHLSGTIDETRLYNREITPCEVQEAMK